MSQPKLTEKVEQKILSIIDHLESKASDEEGSYSKVPVRHYMQLADLYHFQKDFFNEAAILKRFARLSCAANDDLVEIYDRIDRASRLSEIKLAVPEPVHNLALMPREEDQDNLSIASASPKVEKRINHSITPFSQKIHRVLTVCAAYTGRADDDEIVHLALVLFEYNPSTAKPCHQIASFKGSRVAKKKLSKALQMQFGLNQSDYKSLGFDTAKAQQLFAQADLIVSHNDADIERKLIATILPCAVDKPWYSSQKDIPWGALGFDTKRLSLLSKAHGERLPHSCIERAAAISKLLAKLEPCGEQTYLERIYNMPPMKAFVWTEALEKKARQIKNRRWVKPVWICAMTLSVLAASIYTFTHYWPIY